MEVGTISDLFRLYDESFIGNSQWIDFNANLSDFGKFADLYLFFMVTIIKSHRENSEDFHKNCQETIENFEETIKTTTNEKHLNLLNHVIEYLKTIDENKEEKITELTSITNSIYRLFELRLRRAQFDITILSDKSDSRETETPTEKLNHYIKTKLPKYKLDDAQIDPLLLSHNSCQSLQTFIQKHTRSYPLCDCGDKATVYAVPCNCPLYCKDCWEADESFHEQKKCPKCGSSVSEFVEIV